MSSRIDDLWESADLKEIIATPIKEKVSTRIDSAINSFDQVLRDPEPTPEPIAQQPIPPVKVEKPYNAHAAASSMVHSLDALEALIYGAVGGLRIKSNFGGKAGLKEMRTAVSKQYRGKELTKEDKTKIESFEKYREAMQMLKDDFIPTEKESDDMIKAAEVWMEEVQWNVGPGMGFISKYIGRQVKNITTLALI